MNDQTTSETAAPSDSKRSIRHPFVKNDNTHSDTTSKLKTIRSKAKTVAAVVGVVALAGVVAGSVAKKKNVNSVAVTLPDVDVTPDVN